MLADLVVRARSVRKFEQAELVQVEILRHLVNLARLSPCSANRQTLKFLLVADAERNAVVFGHLAWAGYLPDWPGPSEGERPGGYILLLNDEELGPLKEVDAGIVLQSLVLGAARAGLAACILGTVDRAKLQPALGLPARFRILYVLALGKPAESVVVEAVGPDGDVRYWRDVDGLFHVPKRTLDDLIVEV
jgi:nitroreductase